MPSASSVGSNVGSVRVTPAPFASESDVGSVVVAYAISLGLCGRKVRDSKYKNILHATTKALLAFWFPKPAIESVDAHLKGPIHGVVTMYGDSLLAYPGCQTGEVAVVRKETEAGKATSVEQIHGINDHSTICGILA